MSFFLVSKSKQGLIMRKLRCEPGILAIVVNDFDYPENNGKMVLVLGPALPPKDYYGSKEKAAKLDWDCEALQPMQGIIRVKKGGNIGYQDAELLPIRDPDEGATDETLLWLPVPNKTKEEELV
jgi:hypothetical protein